MDLDAIRGRDAEDSHLDSRDGAIYAFAIQTVRDRHDLLAEVDRLRAIVNEEFGPTAANEPGMCECGMDMDAHAGGFALLHHDEVMLMAERARIRADIEGLPVNHDITWADDDPVEAFVNLSSVLAATGGRP
jgi:hypothetical protein